VRLAEEALRAGYRINAFGTLRSTSDEALRQALLGDRGRLWIVAGSQSGGRGRQGRAWASPAGNVYASLLLVDAVAPARAAQLGFVAGVAAASVLKPLMAPGRVLALKWPNDVLVDGAKLAGILVEGTRLPNGAFACIMGFGINRQSHPPDMPYPVTDLFSVSSARPDVGDLVAALSGTMHRMLCEWDAGRGFSRIREAWLEHALPAGTLLTVSAAGRRIGGRFETIDDQGRLVLSGEQGHLQLDAGDVFLAAPPERTTEGAG
jgi:BirA family biotin operon repressor/biotin-[acetyl-CoA-carboxylase] ligase